MVIKITPRRFVATCAIFCSDMPKNARWFPQPYLYRGQKLIAQNVLLKADIQMFTEARLIMNLSR